MRSPRRHVRRLGIVAAALAACALLAAGCSTGSDAVNQQNGGQNRYVAGDGKSQQFDPGDRDKAPSVSGTLLGSGRTLSLASLRGHVVVINYWASWCNPCAAEAPDLEQVYQATKGQGVKFVGVNIRDQRDAAKAFVQGRGMTYPTWFDPAGKVALAFRVVPPNTIPATIIVDAKGRIAAVQRGAILADKLRPMVEKVARGD